MKVYELQRRLDELNPDADVVVRVNTEAGWAMVDVSDMIARSDEDAETTAAVMLSVRMPPELEPHSEGIQK